MAIGTEGQGRHEGHEAHRGRDAAAHSLSEHVNLGSSAPDLVTGRFSRHPERYAEIFRVLRRYRLHHVLAEIRQFQQAAGDEEDDLLMPPEGTIGNDCPTTLVIVK